MIMYSKMGRIYLCQFYAKSQGGGSRHIPLRGVPDPFYTIMLCSIYTWLQHRYHYDVLMTCLCVQYDIPIRYLPVTPFPGHLQGVLASLL